MTDQKPEEKTVEKRESSNRDDEPNRVTFREFIALCLAQYSIALPGLLLTVGCLLGAYGIIYLLFLRN